MTETFRDQLRAAFPAKPIQTRDAFARWGTSYPDAAPYGEKIEGKTWEEMDRAYLVRRSDALGFLDTVPLVGVLPVYLNAMVEDGVWSPATETLTVMLVPAGLGRDRLAELIAALTDAQRAMVAVALRSVAEKDAEGSLGRAARAALDEQWKSFLPAGA
jgi:hypothetical protein